MGNMNSAFRNSSSSCSDEDQQASPTELRAKPTEVSEEHFDKHCKYKSNDIVIKGKTIFIHLRKCKCDSEYEDMSDEVAANDKMDLVPQNGKEIHYYPECKWVSRICKRNGNKVYVLQKYCNGCNTPRTNAPVSTVNIPQKSN